MTACRECVPRCPPPQRRWASDDGIVWRSSDGVEAVSLDGAWTARLDGQEAVGAHQDEAADRVVARVRGGRS